LFGQQSEAADGLRRNGFRLSLGIGSFGLRTEKFFGFVQKVKAHCNLFTPGFPNVRGSKKAAPTGARPGRQLRTSQANCVLHSSHFGGQVCYPILPLLYHSSSLSRPNAIGSPEARARCARSVDKRSIASRRYTRLPRYSPLSATS